MRQYDKGQETSDKTRDENKYKMRDELFSLPLYVCFAENIVVTACGGQLSVRRIGVW